MIRRAKITEIPHILVLTKACAQAMIKKGIYQWNEAYPSQEAFELDVSRDELYVLLKQNRIIGSITLTTFMDMEYEPITWLTPNGESIYVHRLSIHPDFQGMGFAQELMDFAESYAQSKKFLSIRLDTFSKNKRNQLFYETRGYRRLDAIYFPAQSEDPFYCYELVF